MTKKVIQDIVVKRHPQKSRKVASFVKKPKLAEKTEKREVIKDIIPREEINVEKTNIPFLKITFYGLVLVAISFFSLLILDRFNSADVKVSTKEQIIDMDLSLKAFRGMENKDLNFEIMTLDYSEKRNAPTKGVEKVEKKASGQIVIYNTFSSSTQVLAENTRFETPDGKIFRINKKVTVPGSPKSIEVTVYADKAGEEYNVGLVDFTIPGFKGTTKYEKIYARSKTKMMGGYVGEITVASKEDIESTRIDLRKSIEENLFKTMVSQKYEGFLLYKNAFDIIFSSIGHSNETEVEENGSATAYLINQNELEKALIEKYISKEDIDNVDIVNIEKLNFQLISVNANKNELTFKITGQGHFVWKIDSDSLINALISSENKDYEGVCRGYPNITTAEILFNPSWRKHMPSSPKRIDFEHILTEKE